MSTNDFNVTVQVNEEGADAQTQRLEQAVGNFSKKMDESLATQGKAMERYIVDLNKLIDGLAKAAVGIHPDVLKQLRDPSVADEIKGMIGRQMAQAAAKDMSMVRGGSDASGRIRDAAQAGELADLGNSLEAMSAKYANALRGLMNKFSKSIEDMQVLEFAKTPLTSLSSNAATARQQIQAQQMRAGLAANQQFGSGPVAGQLGITDLRTSEQEIGLLNQAKALMAGQKEEVIEISREEKLINAEVQKRVDLWNEELQQHKQVTRSLEMERSILAETNKLGLQQTLGDKNGAQKIEERLANLRIQQLELQGYTQENAEIQTQVGILARIRAEREASLAAAQEEKATVAATTSEMRQQNSEAARLARSQQYAAGEGSGVQVAKNNIIGSRRLAQDPDVQASLLALQAGLSVNYALIGGITSSISTSISSVVEYEDKLRELQAIAGATDGEFNTLRATILKASEDTRLSAVELTEGATLLAQAGVSVAQISVILPKIADAAIATGAKFSDMANLVTTTMNVFNVDVAQTSDILNTFTAALNTSKLDIGQLSTAFQYSANIAAESGVTYQELTAAISGMAQAGIRSGSMIGTGLRQVFTTMEEPTTKLTNLLGQLGLGMESVDIRTQGIIGVLHNLRDAGLTSEQAMGVFEKRTVSALMAAINQVDYMDQLERQLLLSTAAEAAAAKSKESLAAKSLMLKNAFLELINNAAQPFLAVLGGLATGLGSVINAVPQLSVALTPVIAFIGGAAILSVVKLLGSFIEFSGIMTTLGPALALASEGFVTLFGATTAVTLGVTTLNDALLSLEINPVVAALTVMGAIAVGTALAISSLTDKTASYKAQIDAQQTSLNKSKAESDGYNGTIQSIDQTIQRLIDKHQMLTHGQDDAKGATMALNNESLRAANTFNSFGASIDATGESFNRLIGKLIDTKNHVLELEAQTLRSQASMNRVLGNTQASAARSTLQGVVGDRGALSLQLKASGVKDADTLVSQLVGLSNKANLDDNDRNLLARINEKISGQVGKAGFGGMMASGVTGLKVGGISSALSSVFSNSVNSSQSYQNADAASDAGNIAAVRSSKSFRDAAGDIIKPSPNMSASSFSARLADLTQRRKDGLSDADWMSEYAKLQNDVAAAYRSVDVGVQHLKDLKNKNAGKADVEGALDAEISAANNRKEQLGNIGRANAAKQDAFVADKMGGVLTLIKNKSRDKAVAYAKTMGYDWSGLTLDQMEVQAAREKTAAKNGGRGTLYNGPGDPFTNIGIQLAGDVEGSRVDKRNAAADKSAEAKRKQLADALLSANTRAGAADVKLGTLGIDAADKSLTSITKGLSSDDLDATIVAATLKFNLGQAVVKKGLDKQIAAQEQYIKSVAGLIPEAELDAAKDKLDSMKKAEGETLAKNVEQFNEDIIKGLSKIPEIATPFTLLVNSIARNLKGLENKLTEQSAEVNGISATNTVFGNISGRLVRQGGLSSAVADAQQGLYGRQLDAAQQRLLPLQINNMQAQQGALTSGLSASKTNGRGDSITGLQLGQMSADGSLQDYIETQKKLLSSFTGEDKGKQSLFLENLQKELPAILEDYQKLTKVTTDLSSTQEALRQATALTNQTWQQSLEQILTNYEHANGMQNTFMQDMLNSVPQVLGQMNASFKTFFNDIFTGTKSAGDAFKDLAAGILNSMLQVVESEASKALLKLLIDIGTSFLSGGGPAGSNVKLSRASGGDIPSFAALAGMQSGGTEGRDSIPTETMPGEYVLRKSAVDAIGKGTLDQINFQGGRTLSANKPNAVSGGTTVMNNTPFEIYMVSPDKTPPTSKQAIVIAAQEDMLNRGPLYKSVKAIMNGGV